MQTNTGTMFSDQGVSFDDILVNGKLGGPKAVASFLEIRIKQLMRQMEGAGQTEYDRNRLLLAVHAMREAQAIVGSLSNTRATQRMGH